MTSKRRVISPPPRSDAPSVKELVALSEAAVEASTLILSNASAISGNSGSSIGGCWRRACKLAMMSFNTVGGDGVKRKRWWWEKVWERSLWLHILRG